MCFEYFLTINSLFHYGSKYHISISMQTYKHIFSQKMPSKCVLLSSDISYPVCYRTISKCEQLINKPNNFVPCHPKHSILEGILSFWQRMLHSIHLHQYNRKIGSCLLPQGIDSHLGLHMLGWSSLLRLLLK